MAFVSEAHRNIGQISDSPSKVGPGKYFQDEQAKYKKDYAPFKTTSKRKTFLDVKEPDKPGVGNYDISKPFIQPNIKTVSNSQSIIVKINSTGTSQFKSVVDRFDVKEQEVPGPGKYDSPNNKSPKSKKSPQYSPQKNIILKKLQQITKKNKIPAIPQKTRGLNDVKKQIELTQREKLGPAFYDPKKPHHLNSTGTVWGKDKSKRFSLLAQSQVGPGTYESAYTSKKSEEKNKEPSGHFKSNIVRTYWDTLYYKTNINDTAKFRQQSNFKHYQPAPGLYETNTSSLKIQDKPLAFQFFGSGVNRFENQQTPQKKHRSFYQLKSEIGHQKSFNRTDHGFLSDEKRNPQFLEVNDKSPGPGHYSENITVERKLKGNKIQKFGSSTKRSFQVEQKKNQIGPGKYEVESNQTNSMKNTRFGQLREQSFNFKSITPRDCFGSNKAESIPFASYDVTHYDVSTKLQKKKNFIENLKKIDVQKPAFESTFTRFPHYLNKPSPPKRHSEETKQHELRLKHEAERIRDIAIEANKTQMNLTDRSHFGKTQRFNEEKKGGPGVGSYSLRSSWEKKSHNIKFQH